MVRVRCTMQFSFFMRQVIDIAFISYLCNMLFTVIACESGPHFVLREGPHWRMYRWINLPTDT
jgi:hypothetical protein